MKPARIENLLKDYVRLRIASYPFQPQKIQISSTDIEVHIPLWAKQVHNILAHPATFARKWRKIVREDSIPPLHIVPLPGRLRKWEITVKSQSAASHAEIPLSPAATSSSTG